VTAARAFALAAAVGTSYAAAARSAQAQDATITGVVRSGGMPVSGARLDVPELGATVSSDTIGAYQLTGLPAGTLMVRVTRAGYDTVSVLVSVNAHSLLRVDITLSRQVAVLDSVRVQASPAAAGPMPADTAFDDGQTWTWRGDPGLSLASTGEPDLMRMLSANPHLTLRPDWPGSILDHGGTSDQLLVRLDGLPVWSPVHGSGTLSVISPDAIGSVTVRDGATGADVGDRLGGVLDVGTRPAPAAGTTGDAALGPTSMRAAWASPFTIGDAAGGLHLAFRRSTDDLPGANDAGPIPDRWIDGVATAELGTGPTTVRLVFLGSSDRALPYGQSFASNVPSPDAIPWTTGTLGAVWTQRLSPQTSLVSHVSVARFGITMPAAVDSTHSLDNSILQTEVATAVSRGPVTAGVSMDVLNVSYQVSDAPLPSTGLPATTLTTDPQRPPLSLVGTPVVAAAFAERRWGPTDGAWRITTGLRGMALLGTTARLEPRVTGAVRLFPGLIATAGYARTHQVVQSLRNSESPIGAQFGVDLPVAAGTGGVPLAQSDIMTAGIVTQLGLLGRLSVDGYVRSLSGLAVADPLQDAPFATTSFAHASAHIDGLAAQVNGARGPVAWQLGYGIGRTTESAGGVRYLAPSSVGQTGSAAIGVAIDRLTQIRLAGWAAVGQRGPGLDGTSLGHDDDDDGPAAVTAEHDLTTSSALATSLPPYLRADLQLTHQWRVGPMRGRLSTYVTLANIFNHDNLAGTVGTGPAGTLRGITLLPRTVLLGVAWAY
jgi:Carboxypeptidase regulatory-like domain/TonB-dependent Receptor Plug Domain